MDLKNGRIAGIAFQGQKKGEALGYIIPPDIIRHFLVDIQDGKVDGFSDFLFAMDLMENPAKRRYYRMDSARTGVVVDDVDSVLGKDSIRKDDIILEKGLLANKSDSFEAIFGIKPILREKRSF